MKVKCVNDSHRPNEIPISKWVKKGSEYTIIAFWKGGLMPRGGVDLKEIILDADCLPYRHFDVTRFAPVDDIDDLLAELSKDAKMETV